LGSIRNVILLGHNFPSAPNNFDTFLFESDKKVNGKLYLFLNFNNDSRES
jgi:hypothetical protein